MRLDTAHDFISGEQPTHASSETVYVETLRCFPELVRGLGGNPDVLLRRAGIDPALLDNARAVIEYRSVAELLQSAAEELDCADCGQRLAAMQAVPDGHMAIGPLGAVLRNSKTVGEAIEYCANHIHAYSTAIRVKSEPFRSRHRLLRVDILPGEVTDKRQIVEYALLLGCKNALKISAGEAQVRAVLFRHQAAFSLDAYHAVFGCNVRFGQAADGLLFDEEDLRCRVVEADPWMYEMASSYIEARYPVGKPSIRALVRRFVQQHLGGGLCTCEQVAAELRLHPRTLQRRLSTEGASFDGIKDEVRRELAWRYIHQPDMPLARVAEKLGYSEASVLTRSCYRWFAASPRQLRLKVAGETGHNLAN